MTEHTPSTDPDEQQPAPEEHDYEPPRAEEVSGGERAATAAWLSTGEPDDVK